MGLLDINEGCEDAVGVSNKSVVRSGEFRKEFLTRFKTIPTTILKNDVSDLAIDLICHGKDRGYSSNASTKLKERWEKLDRDGKAFHQLSKKEMRIFAGGYRSGKCGSLSRFPQNIGRLLVDFYCPEDGIVYDPFAGHNSRMQLVHTLNRTYIGVDISKEFMQANRAVREMLLNSKQLLSHNKKEIHLIEGSSAQVDLPDAYADFTITSPPYYNQEYYGDEPEQLGLSGSYEAFLTNLKQHITENYRILKEGAFCVWCVNDFVQGGVFYPYHIDLFRLFTEVGFKPFTIYIIDTGTPLAMMFVKAILRSKRFAKKHEYVMIFTK